MRDPDSRDTVIFEFRRVGAFVKVSAVDPRTLTKVSIVGSPWAGEEILKRTARRKLEYVLGKNRTPAARRRKTRAAGATSANYCDPGPHRPSTHEFNKINIMTKT